MSNSVRGCRITGNSANGVYAGAVVVIEANTIDGGTVGVSVSGVTGAVVGGNSVRACGQHGILFVSVTAGAIVGNSVAGNSTGGAGSYDGINVGGTGNNVQMNMVRGSGTQRYGINVSGTDNMVTNNDLLSSGGSGNFNDSGTGTVTTAGNRT
jgi:hypothetical protein